MGDNLLISGLGIIILAGILVFLRVLQIKRLDFVAIFLGTVGVFHGGFPVLIYWVAEVRGLESESVTQLISYADSYAWLYFALVFIFAIGTFLGGILRYKERIVAKSASWLKTLSLRDARRLVFIGWYLLALSVISYWLFSKAYGGFFSLFLNAMYIRAGLYDDIAAANPWSFLGKFGGLSFISSFIFLGVLIAKPQPKKLSITLWAKIGFLLSFFFSLFVIWSWWSRSHFLFYMIALIGAPLIRKSRFKFNLKRMWQFIVILAVLVVLLSAANYKFKGVKTMEDQIARFANDASIRILPTFVLLENPEYRWFKDLGLIPVYFLPQKIWRKFVQYTASDVITVKMMGGRKGESGVTGAMVIGAVPFSFLEGGVMGVAILGVIWGMFLGFLDRWLLVKLPPGISELLYAYIAFRLVVTSICGADPQVVIYNTIDIIIGLLFIFMARFQIKVLAKDAKQLKDQAN